MCFSYLYAGLYVHSPFTTVAKISAQVASILQYLSLINFVVIPTIFAIMSLLSDFSFPPQVYHNYTIIRMFLLTTSIGLFDFYVEPLHTRYLCVLSLCWASISTFIEMDVSIILFFFPGSYISNQAWNLINSQSSIFHEWLPRAAKIVGKYLHLLKPCIYANVIKLELFLSFFLYAVYFYPVFLCYHASYRSRLANFFGAWTTCTLFGLRFSLDLPSYVITYARSVPFLTINLLAAIPTFVAYSIVLIFFVTRCITFQQCTICSFEFLEVQDIEEKYVKVLIASRQDKEKKSMPIQNTSMIGLIWLIFNEKLWKKLDFKLIFRLICTWKFIRACIRKLFGIHEHVRIPFAIKTSLTLLLYCLGQLVCTTECCE